MSDGAMTDPQFNRSEHIDENISAKRVAPYNWTGTSWQRQTVGFADGANLTTDISTPGTIIETDGVRTLTTTITSTSITEVWS